MGRARILSKFASKLGLDSKVQAAGIAPEATAGTVTLSSWTITEAGGVLYFSLGGVKKAKLDSSGNLTVISNVTGYGTV